MSMTMTLIEETDCNRKCGLYIEKRCYTKTMQWLQTKIKPTVGTKCRPKVTYRLHVLDSKLKHVKPGNLRCKVYSYTGYISTDQGRREFHNENMLITQIIIHCSHHLSSHWLKAYS